MAIEMLNLGNRLALLSAAAMAVALVSAPAAFGHDYTVVMSNMDYGALPSGLKVGDTILWVNHDTVLHSITARDHSFDIRLSPGKSATQVMDKAGRIAFICLFHPTMSGALVVAPK